MYFSKLEFRKRNNKLKPIENFKAFSRVENFVDFQKVFSIVGLARFAHSPPQKSFQFVSWKFILKWGVEVEGVFSLSMLPVIVIMMMSSLFWWPRVLKMMMVWPAPAPSGSVCGVTVPPRGRSPVLQTQKRQKPFVPQGSFQNYKIQGGQQSPLFMAMGNSVRHSQWVKFTQKSLIAFKSSLKWSKKAQILSKMDKSWPKNGSKITKNGP